MAQRKPTTVPSKKPASGARSPAGSAKPSGPTRRPPAKKPGKSIVNQKQRPWGLIITTVVLVLFAAGIVAFAVAGHNSGGSPKTAAGGNVAGCTKMIGNNSSTYLNELVCAKDIKGVTFKPEANRNHVTTTVNYDSAPPVGGNHSAYWADCTGTVYSNAIANENAVHMLEHGAVWITYNPKTLPAGELDTLRKLVAGQDRMALSPYPNLKTPISLQSWGYQVFVDKASDPRVQQFINDLRYNPRTTPEYGAICSQPTFKVHPSTFGHPLFAPAG
ncbi:MAG: DUF3105 domain-containing protein [Actinomycetota bacterium]|nr:DUF3105 domain-containing protein [Actinomycetota bacterium]